MPKPETSQRSIVHHQSVSAPFSMREAMAQGSSSAADGAPASSILADDHKPSLALTIRCTSSRKRSPRSSKFLN
jgi:hypothetical protein